MRHRRAGDGSPGRVCVHRACAGADQGERRCEFQAGGARAVPGRHDQGQRHRRYRQQPLRAATATAFRRAGREERDLLRRDRHTKPREDARYRQEHHPCHDHPGRVRRVQALERLFCRRRPDVRAVLTQQHPERGDASADRLRCVHVQPERADPILHGPRHGLPGQGELRQEPARVPDWRIPGTPQCALEQRAALRRPPAIQRAGSGDRLLLRRHLCRREEDPCDRRSVRHAESLSRV